MTKIYASSFKKSRFFSKVFLIAALFMACVSFVAHSQVRVIASIGDPLRTYPTLREAFVGINTGVHGGTISIEIYGNTTEGLSAVLNSNGAGLANYNSVTIYPTGDGITVTGNPGTGRGVIELNGADNITIDGDNPNTGGTNRNLNIINADVNTIALGSCIRLATSAAVTSTDEITIQNCLLTGNVNNGGAATNASSPSAQSFGIYAGGNSGATATAPPLALTNAIENAGSAVTMNDLLFQNNEINQVGRAIQVNGAATTVSNSVTVEDNLVGPATAGLNGVYLKGILIAGANSAIVNNNQIRNIASSIGFSMTGIELANPIGSGTISINNNTINSVTNGGTNHAIGILVSNAAAAYTVSGNTISDISSAGALVNSIGILINSAGGAVTIQNNKVSKINGTHASTKSRTSGIYLQSSANGAKIINNFIWDIKHSVGDFATYGAYGIGITSGSNHKIYHNSINLNTASAGAASSAVSCIFISSNGLSGMDIRNNILNNSLAPVNATSVSTCIFMPFTYTPALNYNINNNGYFTSSGTAAIGFAGNTAYAAPNVYTTLAAWQAITQTMGNGSNDVYSVNPAGAAPFASATDLHIPNGTTTALEGGGAPLGVATDIDAQSRNTTTPDIGADEFTGTVVDNVPPTISYSLPADCAASKTITATISDPSGVPTAGLSLPILKWKINAGAWNTVTATWVAGATYTFAGVGGGSIPNDVVSFFIVASDLSPAQNITAAPAAGAGGYVVAPTDATIPPTNPYTYTYFPGLTGTYTIGPAGNYPTLTAAVADFNTSCLTSNVVFELNAGYTAAYSLANETYPIVINNNIYTDGTSGSFTLTIKPAGSTNPVISGANGQALLKLNGADRIIIDGSNNGTTSKNLSIINSDVNSSAAIIWLTASSSTNGATYNIIKNCNISAPYAAGVPVVLAGIFSSANAANSNNTIQNNTIKGVYSAIAISGKLSFPSDQNWLITDNTLGSTVVTEKLGLEGIAMEGAGNFTISNNTILGIANLPSTTDFLSGILLGNSTYNGQVSGNRISDIKFNSIWGTNGICLASNNPVSNITVYNNFIWDIASTGWSGYSIDDNGNGIMVYTGGGYNIYYNSISMNAAQTSGFPAAINISANISTSNTLDIRNNIFSNTGTGGTRFGIVLQAPNSVLKYLDFNDYYATNFVGRGNGTNANTIAAWRSITGLDNNSLAVNPQFTSATNLHLVPATSPLNQMATPITGITNDIDGDVRNATKPDIGADEFNGPACSGAPVAGTITANTAVICVSGNVLLNATGYGLAEGINFQWQWSADNFGSSINDITGQTSPASATYATAGVQVWFRLKATCTNGGAISFSNIVSVNVSNPQVSTTTPGSRCGIGTVTLGATGPVNTTLDWYATSDGGSVLGSGTSFTTPTIGNTTTYYVAAQPNPASYPADLAKNYGFSTSTSASLDAMIGATNAIGTGNDDATKDTMNIGFTFHFAGADYTKFGVNVNGWLKLGNTPVGNGYFSNDLTTTDFNPKITAFWDDQHTGTNGGVDYLLTGTAPYRVLKVQWTTNRYPGSSDPYTMTYQLWLYETTNIIEMRYGAMNPDGTPSSSVGITSAATDYQSVTISTNTSSISSVNNGNSAYPSTGRMYRFVPPAPPCQSARTPVIATISSAPSINAVVATDPAPAAVICDGQSTQLSITSGSDPNYTYTWTPGALTGPTQNVSPNTTTEYTVNALYTGPGVYNGCTNQAAITVYVIQSPPVMTLDNTSITSCPADNKLINITGGLGSVGFADIGVSTTNRNGGLTTTSNPGMPPFGAWYTGSRQQILYSAAELTALGFVGGTVLNSIGFNVVSNDATDVGYSNFTIKIGQTAATSLTTTFLTDPTTQVYVNNFAVGQPAAGWNNFAFGTGVGSTATYTWDGTSSIFIETYFSNCLSCSGTTCNSTNWGYNAILENSPAPFAAHSIYYGDFTSCSINTLGPAQGVVNFRPNTRFGYNTQFIPVWTDAPANGAFTIMDPPDNTQIQVFPNVTTTYTATTTNTLGCPRTVSAVVTVNSPVATVSIASVPVSPICAGSSVTFTATPTNGGPVPGYQWQLNGSNIPGETNSTYTTTTLVTGDKVKVVMTSNLTPCTPPPVTSNEITMTVNPLPVCNITGAASVCATSAGNVYTNTITPAGGTVVHAWSISGNGSIIGATNGASVTVTAGAAGSFILTDAVTREGCSPASVCSYTVTVNPNLAVSATIAASPAGLICTGTSVTFIATPTNGGATPGYQWQLNGINVPGETNPTFTTSTLANTDQVRVILTSSEACTSGNPFTSTAITMGVTGSAPASVTLASSNACAGQSVTLTATPINGGATPTYDFYVNTILVASGSASNTYSFTPAGTFSAYVILHSSILCPNPNNATSATINITPNPLPTVSVGASCTNLLIGSGQQTKLTATAVPNTGVDYTWTLLPATPVGTNSTTYTTGTAGTYQVSVEITATGCANTATQVITSSAGALAAGTYIIPTTGCNGFDKISSAVNYINTNGISGTGGVIFDITPGYSEIAPIGGYNLTATGTATNGITFQKGAGAGAVTITANSSLSAGNTKDAIFLLNGSDYITIKGLTMEEHGAPLNMVQASNNLTEWGIAMIQGTPSGANGAQHNTIQDNIISLARGYANSIGIYSNSNHNYATITALVTLTSADGTNSYNKIYGNTISNVNTAIYFHGSTAQAYYDLGNDVGGTGAATGNTISNWGGQVLGLYFVDGANSRVFHGCIILKNQLGNTCSYSTVTTSGITGLTVPLRGIYQFYSTTLAFTSATTTEISHNNLSLDAGFNTLSAEWSGIRIDFNNVLITNMVLNVNYNTVSGTFDNPGGGTIGTGSANAIGAIHITIRPSVVNCNNNTVENITETQSATAGYFAAIYDYAAAPPASIKTYQNNVVQNINWGGNGMFGLVVNNNTTGTTVVQNNTINNLFNAGIGAMYGMSIAGANATVVSTVSQNSISNLSGAGQIMGVQVTGTQTLDFSNNTINGLTSTSTTAVVYGIQNQVLTPGTVLANNITSNLSSNATTPGGASVFGIFAAYGCNLTNNQIWGLTSNAISGNGVSTGIVGGIYFSATTTAVTVNKNRIYDLSLSNTGTTAIVNGILTTGVKTATITNNFISDLRAPNMGDVTVLSGIRSTSTTATSTIDVFYNTIYLNATNSTSTDFGTSGIFHTSNATATTAVLNLRNNIIVNTSDFRGAGKTAGVRRTLATLNNYNVSSNNNSIYVGAPDASHVIYSDNSNDYTTLNNFLLFMGGTRESKTVSAMPTFVNIATTPYDLHLTPTNNCSFDGQGDNTGILIPDDYDGDARSTVSPYITDIGADEFTGTGGGTGVWAGINSNWMDPINWCGAVPGSTTNVTIPTGKSYYPIINGIGPEAKNITINGGGTVTITGAGKLDVYGTIATAGIFNTLDGTIEMHGNSAQTIPAAAFQNNDLKNLVINNASVTLGGALNLYGKLSFTGSNRTLATGGFLTLRSLATGTASVGDITNNGTVSGNTITGDVTVERFIKARRAWRYLSMPTQHNLQTIKESWQENMPANSTSQSTPAGYGIHLIKDSANAVAYGFDQFAGVGPSLKTYVAANNSWKGVTATNNATPAVSNGRFQTGVGYMVIIRGDRTANLFSSPVTSTTLREKGALVLGSYAFPAGTVPAGKFQGIGNPYASAVEFGNLSRTNLDNTYYMWDPQMGTLGSYVSFAGPTYDPTASISYTTNHYIESGQAFFVHASGPAGTLTFNEPSKVDGSNLVTRQANTGAQRLKTMLYSTVDNAMRLFDGTINEFGSSFSNLVNNQDAIKPTNSGENLGIRVGNQILSVERHAALLVTDTIFYNLTQARVAGYRFDFVPENMDPILTGYLIDNYLKTSTEVSMLDTTRISFNIINDPGSYAADRFYMVFKRADPVPVTFIDVRAIWQNKDIKVSWDVANEEQIQHYEVERSANGSSFGKVHAEPATGVPSYNWLDTHPLNGDNFYRIRAVGIGGDIKYSEIVKVSRDKKASQIAVYPNPVKDDGILYVDMQNKPAGIYQVQLLNEAGQLVHTQSINHSGGSSVYSIQLYKMLAHGNYLLKVSNGSDVKLSFKVVF